MLGVPDQSFDHGNLGRLADWLEVACLLADTEGLSIGVFVEELHDSLLLAGELPEGIGSSRDYGELLIGDALSQVRRRQRAYGDAYPFSVLADGLERTGGFSENLCFSTLLVADIGRFYTGVKVSFSGSSKLPRLFEKVVQSCLQQVLGGTSVRFGWPIEPGWPTLPKDRIRKLADEFDLEPENLNGKVRPRDKDLGLDVATRFKFGDEGPGVGVLLTQCATGDNWKGKTGEPSIPEWNKLLAWDSALIRGVAFPWRKEDDRLLARLASRFDAVLFDRERLLSAGNPDTHLDGAAAAEIQKWCEDRCKEFNGKHGR